MKLSIVIVSFNTKKLLESCLKSLMVNGQWLMANGEVIVVDNGSTDGSVKMINEEWLMVKRKKSSTISHKQSLLLRNQPLVIKLISNQENLGFAKANNQALRQTEGDYVFLLNSDAQVKPGALEKLIEFAQEHPEAGAIGARLLNPDGSIQPSAYHLPAIWGAIKEFWLGKRGTYEKYAVVAQEAVDVEAVTFAATLIPKAAIEKIGLLDERYFMYFEDLDYCRRAKKAGLKVYYLPQAEIVHYHGASGKGSSITYQYLVESSKIYNGRLKYWFLTFIIWFGQKWQNFFGCF